jgi:hypothetical protein
MSETRREAKIEGGPHSGQVLIAELDEKESVIAVFYSDVNGKREFVADYWFETFEDMEEAFKEMGWQVEWAD